MRLCDTLAQPLLGIDIVFYVIPIKGIKLFCYNNLMRNNNIVFVKRYVYVFLQLVVQIPVIGSFAPKLYINC